jgi:hypothetical protein
MTPDEALEKAGGALKKAEEVLEKTVTSSVTFEKTHESWIQLAERWMMYAEALKNHPASPITLSYKPYGDSPYPGTASPMAAASVISDTAK